MGILHKTPFSIGLIPNLNLITAIAVILTFLQRARYVCGSSGGVMGGSDWDSYSDSSYDSYDSSYLSSSSYSSYDDDDYHRHHRHQLYSSPRQESSAVGLCVFVTVVGAVMVIAYVTDTHDRKTSVVKVQVALYGNLRSLQNDLNQIARSTVDTSTRRGMRSILRGTLESLKAYQKSYISTYSSSKIFGSIDEGKELFNQLSRTEQAKFDEETLVNVNNMKRERTEGTINAYDNDMYLVITILVAAQGGLKLSNINTSKELIKALKKLLSIPESKTRAVRVFWTPQQKLDTLSREQILEDYPQLRPLSL